MLWGYERCWDEGTGVDRSQLDARERMKITGTMGRTIISNVGPTGIILV